MGHPTLQKDRAAKTYNMNPPTPNPAEAQQLQQMKTQIFDELMKAEDCEHEDVDQLTRHFKTVLPHYSLNALKASSAGIEYLMSSRSFFTLGFMLNVLRGAPFDKANIGYNDILEYTHLIEDVTVAFNEKVKQCDKTADRDLKIKLSLTNSPLAKFIK